VNVLEGSEMTYVPVSNFEGLFLEIFRIERLNILKKERGTFYINNS